MGGITESIGDFTGDVVGGLTGASQQADAASEAANIQAGMSREAIAEQRRQFDSIVELMRPFIESGYAANTSEADLLGLNGLESQAAAIQAIEQSPQFASMIRQGEEGILQNASATGGLRGGNVQRALSQYRPDVLNAMIQQRFANLRPISSQGQASAGLQAGAGQNAASNIGNLLSQQGAALAGGALARGSVTRQGFQDASDIGAGLFRGLAAF